MKKHHAEEQILGILKEAEMGKPLSDLLRQHAISNGTFYRWKSRYGGLEPSWLQRLKYSVSRARACGLLHLAVSSYYQSHGRREEEPVRSALLDYLTELPGRSAGLLTDNSPEFAGLALERWAPMIVRYTIASSRQENHSQNGYIESFDGKLRDECLNEHKFINLTQARDIIEAFREDYNDARPHSSLAHLTPNEFAAKIARAPMGAPLDQTNPLAVETPLTNPTSTHPVLSF